LPGADNRHVHGVAHVQLARQEIVFCEVLRHAAIQVPLPDRSEAG
jgi:hypothetical protein